MPVAPGLLLRLPAGGRTPFALAGTLRAPQARDSCQDGTCKAAGCNVNTANISMAYTTNRMLQTRTQDAMLALKRGCS
jgi:hypothetical protein